MPVDRIKLEHEIRLKLAVDGELRHESREFADEVRDTWVRIWESMGPHPYETRDYARSIQVHGVGRAIKYGQHPKGAPGGVGGRFTGKNVYAHYRVSTDDPIAPFIEYGTGPDVKGVGVWQDLDGNWHRSPKTPTPEFAPAAHTAAFYHGTAP